ncbi:hypothetical protein HOLleu_27059 [Holothuria leucospilota]|uniref:Uncharacterized protein n=1 Tax=Holothuria leucospilota TaxID=206669 RepID=A0A9Q1H2Y5_HOLLE|nr:hypothetical protein HOLleu_27059 [Holothuria leucospilota]
MHYITLELPVLKDWANQTNLACMSSNSPKQYVHTFPNQPPNVVIHACSNKQGVHRMDQDVIMHAFICVPKMKTDRIHGRFMSVTLNEQTPSRCSPLHTATYTNNLFVQKS